MKFTYILLFLVTICRVPSCFGGIIRDFLQNNVAGPPVNFEQQSWPIDPEAGIRRRKDYIEANGLYGYKHVERIGLGEDGRTEERRIQQRIRDSIGALSYQRIKRKSNMKRSASTELNSKSENQNSDPSENDNFCTNNCSKICSIPIGGVRAKVKQHFCNIGNDSVKVNKNLNLGIQNKAEAGSGKGSLQNGASHMPSSSSSVPSSSSSSSLLQSPPVEKKVAEKEENDMDYYVKHNVDSLDTIEKCPPKVGNQPVENIGANGHLRNRMWNLRDDESSSGNEGDETLSDHECCIYTYKGDQFADLPSSFFKLDLITNSSDHVAEVELPKELVAGDNERSHSGSSPEMDFLEMDFDPGPSIEQDSEEDYDCFDGKVKTGGSVSPVPELPNENVTENDLSRNVVTDSDQNFVMERSGNDLGLASNFKNHPSPEPQPGPSGACASYEFPDKSSPIYDKRTEHNNSKKNKKTFKMDTSDSTTFFASNWPAKGIWGNHYMSGDLCSSDVAYDSEPNNSLPLWNAGNLKIQGDVSHDTKTYNIHSAFYHWIMGESLVFEKINGTGESNSSSPTMEDECSSSNPVVDTAMIWSEQEACAKQITQISTSACGATAVINVMIAFNMRFILEKVKESVATRLRAESAPIPQYLVSRSYAGVTHDDIIRGVHESSNGALFARFFHMYPERDFSLSNWLSYWIKKGAVPIATLNLQIGKTPGYPIPDAWHHQMIFGVSSRGIFLTNPLECVEEQVLMVKLCSPSVLKIKRSDIISRWNPSTDLRPLMYQNDRRWKEMNVLGQVVNVIRELSDTSVQGRVITQHISIPASYSSGITLVIPKESPGYNELVSVPELPMLQTPAD